MLMQQDPIVTFADLDLQCMHQGVVIQFSAVELFWLPGLHEPKECREMGVIGAGKELQVPIEEGSVLLSGVGVEVRNDPLGASLLLFLEAYAQHVGQVIAPEAWKHSRGTLHSWDRLAYRPGITVFEASNVRQAKEVAIHVDLEGVADGYHRMVEVRRLPRLEKAAVEIVQGMHHGHAKSPSWRAAATSMTPSDIRARKNCGVHPSA